MSRRIAVAGFQHETNTFAPIPTTLDIFERGGTWPPVTRGLALFETFRGLNIPMSGFLEAADDVEIAPLLWAAAEPGGLVADAAFDRLAGEICQRLAEAMPVDGVYLDLHGAMVTESHADGEAELLRRVREVTGPDLPIVVSLDLHGNMSREFFDRASAVVVYRTYPHVDMAPTGARAADLLQRILDQGPFCRAWAQADFLTPITGQSTFREPGRSLYAMLPGLCTGGVVSVDLAFGFPPADIPDCGPSIYAYGTDQGAVDAALGHVAAALAAAEADIANPIVPAAEAVAQAMRNDDPRPVVIADPQDNPGAGATGDATGLLRALLEAGATDAALAALWDPDSAARAHAAGVGAEIDVALGGRFPETGGAPIEGRAVVEHLSDGRFTCRGPFYNGSVANLGPMATLRMAGVRVVLASRRGQNADRAFFAANGIDPERQRILAVKSAVHFLADYEPMASRVLFAAAPGANPCDLPQIPYTRLRHGLRLGPLGPAFAAGQS